MTIGILSAMAEELEAVLAAATITRATVVGGRRFYEGTLHGQPVVLVVSRIGKVAAAITATLLLERFGVTHVLFTGLAGGVDRHVRVGDIVVASALVHHDLDTRPLFPRFEIPLLGRSHLPTDPRLVGLVRAAAEAFCAAPPAALIALGIARPQVHVGVIASGDQFIHARERVIQLRDALPDALAVEMEGAAVGQVCTEHEVPCAVVRVISDHADDDAGVSFTRFLGEACGLYASQLVQGTLERWDTVTSSGPNATGDGVR